MKDVLTVKEVAYELGCDRRTVASHYDAGRLTGPLFGGKHRKVRRITRQSLDDFKAGKQ